MCWRRHWETISTGKCIITVCNEFHDCRETTGRKAMTDRELQLKAVHLRKKTLEAIFEAGAGHTGGGLSCLDILNVLYNRVLNVSPETFANPMRDRYVQSKGHSVEAL